MSALQPNQLHYSTRQAAQLLGCGKTKFYQLVNDKRIAVTMFDGRIRISRKALDESTDAGRCGAERQWVLHHVERTAVPGPAETWVSAYLNVLTIGAGSRALRPAATPAATNSPHT